jgi:hypothetical protein
MGVAAARMVDWLLDAGKRAHTHIHTRARAASQRRME